MADTINATILWRHLLVPLNHFSVAKIRIISGTAKLFGNYFCYQRLFIPHVPLFPGRFDTIFPTDDTAALNCVECRRRLGITIEQAHGFCSRLALPLTITRARRILAVQHRNTIYGQEEQEERERQLRPQAEDVQRVPAAGPRLARPRVHCAGRPEAGHREDAHHR